MLVAIQRAFETAFHCFCFMPPHSFQPSSAFSLLTISIYLCLVLCIRQILQIDHWQNMLVPSCYIYIGKEQKLSWRLFLIYHFIHISLHLFLHLSPREKKITLSILKKLRTNIDFILHMNPSSVGCVTAFVISNTFSLAFHFGRS